MHNLEIDSAAHASHHAYAGALGIDARAAPDEASVPGPVSPHVSGLAVPAVSLETGRSSQPPELSRSDRPAASSSTQSDPAVGPVSGDPGAIAQEGTVLPPWRHNRVRQIRLDPERLHDPANRLFYEMALRELVDPKHHHDPHLDELVREFFHSLPSLRFVKSVLEATQWPNQGANKEGSRVS